jgi:hypothetical protein
MSRAGERNFEIPSEETIAGTVIAGEQRHEAAFEK